MLMQPTNLIYTDYKWQAIKDHVNPKIIEDIDHEEFNRTEGYEMLYFINSLAQTWGWKNPHKRSFQKLERIIRIEVPDTIHKHSEIMEWISAHYRRV